MNKNHYLFIGGFAFAVLFLGAVLFSGQPPVSRTAAPGETNCTACHGGILNAGPGNVTLTGPANYTPGMVHQITVTVTDATKSRFGFEVTALNSGNLAMGTIAAPSANTSLQNGNVSGNPRQYVGHSNANTNNTWTFNWTAPATASGPVTFYGVGNASNNNGSTSGDNIYTQTLVISPPANATASFTASPTTVCLGDAVTFTDGSMGGITSYAWDFGANAIPATASSIGPHSVTYTSTGFKVIELIVDGTGGPDTFDQAIMVVDLPATTITANGSTSFCPGDSVVLSAGNFASYMWTTGDTTATISVNTSGITGVIITDNNGCQAGDTITTALQPSPTVAITPSGPITICMGDTAILDAGSPFGSYLWSTNETTQTIQVTAAGTYMVSVTDTAFGCSGIASRAVVISMPMATFTGLDTAYCVQSGLVGSLSGSPANGVFGGPGLVGPTTFDPVSAGIGTHEIFYAITDSIGCVDTARQTVAVRPRTISADINNFSDTTLNEICPTGGIITLSGTPSGGSFFTASGSGLSGNIIDPVQVQGSGLRVGYAVDDGIGCTDTTFAAFTVARVLDSIAIRPSATFCQGDTIMLTAVGPGINHIWSNGDTTQSIFVSQSGMFTVAVQAPNLPGCTVTSRSVMTTATALPMPVIAGTTDFSTGSFRSYQWYFSNAAGDPLIPIDGATDSTLAQSAYSSDSSNTGFIVVGVTDRNGCEGISAVVTAPITIGIFDQFPTLSLEMYPNPVQERLYLEFELKTSSQVEMVLLDARGKIVFRKAERFGSGSAKTSLPVSELATGMYLLQVKTADGYTVSKFVKE